MYEYNTIPWEVIRIPAWLDAEAAELLGMEEGGSYFPEWKTDELLKIDESEIRASNGSRYWNSLYMQDPTPEEGGLIKKQWLQEWKYGDPTTCDFVIQTYDTAFSTRTTADYSVIQTWGIFFMTGNTRMYVLFKRKLVVSRSCRIYDDLVCLCRNTHQIEIRYPEFIQPVL